MRLLHVILVSACLAVSAAFCHGQANPSPCRSPARRSLAQGTSASTPSPLDAQNTSSTVYQTVGYDLMQHSCVVTFNAFFYSAEQYLLSPLDNRATTSQACCLACRETKNCTAWQWCPLQPGCNITGPLSHYAVPYLGCQLLRIPAFSTYDSRFQGKYRGSDIPLVSGAPIDLTFAQVDSYNLNPGSDMGGFYDYNCSESTVSGRCQVTGGAQQGADACTADPLCEAFVFRPNGTGLGFSVPVCTLKRKPGNLPVNSTDFQVDPSAAVYVKQVQAPPAFNAPPSPPTPRREPSSGTNKTTSSLDYTPTDNSSNNSGRVTGIAVAATVGSIIVIAVILLTYYYRRYRKPAPGFLISKGDGHLDKDDAEIGEGSGTSSVYSAERNSSGVALEDGVVGAEELDHSPLAAIPGGHAADQMHVAELLPRDLPAVLSTSSHGSLPPGSSALELLQAFSQMYSQRPLVDYVCMSNMLEDEEAEAAAEAEKQESCIMLESEVRNEGPTRNVASPPPDVTEQGLVVNPEDTSDWYIRPEDVEVCRRPDGSWWQLGVGAFGTVYKAIYRGNLSVAIKILHRHEEQRHSDAFAREVALLTTLRDRHIVKFLGGCLDGPQGMAMLLTELMELGDLWRALTARDSSGERLFGWWRRGRRVLEDVARGLTYLHSKRIVHFDLKSANILLSRAGTAKLADIGMARVLDKSYLSIISSGLGTFAWSAPEVLAGRRCSEKADIYSWGVVLWEVCTGEAPVRGNMRPLQCPDDCPAEVVELHSRCLAEDPDERPSAREILEILTTMPKTNEFTPIGE